MHWGNIGSAIAGLGTLIVAVFAILGLVRHGPAWLEASRERQAAQAEKARAEADLARKREQEVELERRARLHGWSPHGLDTFRVALVTAAEEMDQAREELAGGGPTSYVILRLAEREGKSTDAAGRSNRGKRLRQIIESEGFISRQPTPGEREALEKGLITLGIARAPEVYRIPTDEDRRRVPLGTPLAAKPVRDE